MNIDAGMAGADNPYIIGRPIYEREFFFGRENLFRFIQDNLKQGVKVILLHGQRRIGKSSVLSQITNFVQLEQFVFIPLSLQGKSHKPLSDVLHELAVDITDCLSDELDLSVDNIILPSRKDLNKNIQIFTDNFLPQLYELLDGNSLVLLLDEFDVLDSDSQDAAINQFFPYLKSIVEQQEKLFIIPVVGRQLEDMHTLVLGLFREAPKQEIGLLNEPNAERLIIEPAKGVLEYNPDAIQAIRELSAGHPYFMQVLCFALFSKARDEQRSQVTRADVESVVEQAISIGGGGLAWFRDGLPIPERVIFSAVAEAQRIAATRDNQFVGEPLKLLEEYGVVQTKALEQAGKRLVEWGFLDLAEGLDSPSARSPTYKVKIELVRRWLVKQHPLRQEIWQLEKLNSEAHRIYEEAVALQQQNGWLNQLKLYEQALGINPNHFSALFEVAHGYLRLKAFDKAIDYYTRAYQIEPVRAKDGLIQAVLNYNSPGQKEVVEITKKRFIKILEQQPNQEEFRNFLEWLKSLPKPIPPCPYPGLFAFREEDAPYFFGREHFTQQMVAAVRRQPLVAVIGPSGCGKSSVVFAGLLPQLRSENRWLINVFRPSDRPFHNLATNLVPLLETQINQTDTLVETQKLATQLQQQSLGLQDVIIRILEKNSGSRLLLVVDQFEELYTLCWDSSERHRFLDQLLEAVNQVPNFTLVLTLRADFLGYALSYPPFADAWQKNTLLLSTMAREELLEAVTEPATLMGVQIEEGLTERLLEAVEESRGNLPLLEFTLTQLWAKQQNGQLTHRAYEEIGGLNGALTNYAERVYQDLSETEQQRAWKIFLQLVRPGEGTEDIRRLATRAEMGEDNWYLVRRLADARLVITGRNKTIDEESVEIVHEALIREWARLRQWIDNNRSFRTWQERLRVVLREWEATKRDEGALLRGVPLAEAEDWVQTRQAELSLSEQNFIQQSVEMRDRELRLRVAQRRRIIVGLVSNLVVTLMLAGAATWQWQQAKEQRLLVTRIKDKSFSATFSPQGNYLVTKSLDRIARVLEANSGREVLRLENVNSVAISPDGKILASAGTDKIIRLWNLNTGKLIRSLQGSSGEIYSIAISPDGKTLISGGADHSIRIWDLGTGELAHTLISSSSSILSIKISPDGRTFASTSIDRTIQIWDLHTGRLLKTIAGSSD